MLKILSDVLYNLRIRGNYIPWRLREILNLPPANPIDAVRRKYGKEGLRKAYKENLEIVLKHVAKLVDNLPGKIIITADHGEALGENACYSHWNKSANNFLLEIPWLAIDKGQKNTEVTAEKKQEKTERREHTTDDTDHDSKRQIQERLKALGYFD